MKKLITLLFTTLNIIIFAQDYPFSKDFTTGKVTLQNSSILEGELKWFPSQNGDLKFRKTKEDKTTKYRPSEVINFSVDKMTFVPLKNFNAFADNYALIGKTTEIKDAFVQIISQGKFNIYLATITGYDPISRKIQNYNNFIFQNSQEDTQNLYAYPYLIRMKDKKYENAKENLYILFKNYPEIIEKIKAFQKEDNFLEIIDMISNIK